MHSCLKVASLVALLSFAAPSMIFGQTQTASPAGASDGSVAAPSFEVATIKRNLSGDGGSSSGFGRNSDLFKATNMTVKGLLRFEAFDIADERIVGGPKWLDSVHFDIEAKLDPADASRVNSLSVADKKALQERMIQSLLTGRFHLTTHWEVREQPIYELTVAKGGPKLQPAADTKQGSYRSMNYGKFEIKGATLARLADLLTQGAPQELGRVVVDRTGIEGEYDINLKWSPDTGTSSTDSSIGPSLFTAIQEQLGIKLEPSKGPVKVLVIDRLEMPSDN